MHMFRNAAPLLAFAAMSVLAWAHADIKVVDAGDAASHLLNRKDPVYPPLAKAARIQGTVEFEFTVTQAGTVADVTLKRGHPLLVTAAKEALVQWTYKPFEENGTPIPIRTSVEIPFSLGIDKATYEKENDISNAYFAKFDSCDKGYKAHSYDDAETSCLEAIKLVEQLPQQRQLERVNAYDLLGRVMLSERKYPEALSSFQKSLTLAQGFLQRNQAELAYEYYHTGLGFHVNGQPDQAAANYREAETVLTAARNHIGDDFLKGRYAKTLVEIYNAHATLLQQTGDASGAAEVLKQAALLQK